MALHPATENDPGPISLYLQAGASPDCDDLFVTQRMDSEGRRRSMRYQYIRRLVAETLTDRTASLT